MKEQARLCGVDLDVELELERKWGAGPPETERDSEQTATNRNASTIPASVAHAAEPTAVFIQDELDLEKRYGKEIVNRDGYFLPRSWVFAQSNEILFDAPQQEETDNDSSSPFSTTIVHTFVRNQDGESVCHDKHPFVACVHLLRRASDSSIVHLSVPYLSDLHFIDELCHYAKPIDQGAKI